MLKKISYFFILLFLLISILIATKLNQKPRKINSQAATVSTQTIEGTLEGLIADDFQNNKSKERYFLNQIINGELKKIEIDFNTKEKPKVGSKVRLTGVINQNGVLDITTPSGGITVIESPVPPKLPISGVKKVAIIHVNFNNLNTQTPTSDFSKTLLDGAINNYFKEVSIKDSVSLLSYANSDSFDWMTMAIGANCDQNTIVENALQTAVINSSINFDNYSQVMIIFPEQSSCPYGAFAYLPPGYTTTVNGISKTILVSAFQNRYITQHGIVVIPHEFGHSFGARHSGGLECGLVSIGDGCQRVEYGDALDVMGANYDYISTYGAYEKEVFGWINSSNSKTVTISGRYTVDPIEFSSNGVQQLKIPMTGPQASYMEGFASNYIVENRVGENNLDSNLPATAFTGGLIKIAPQSIDFPLRTLLIDSTPNLAVGGVIESYTSIKDFRDSPFAYGQAFDDPNRGIRIKPVNKIGGVLSVDVTFYPPTQISPSNGADVGTLQTFYWSSIPNATSYAIQIALDSAFTQKLLTETTTVPSFTPSASNQLPANTTLYWRVWANYPFGTSDSSPSWVMKTVGDCSSTAKYCPTDEVTRAQMAVFLLKKIHGSSYNPPPAVQVFPDVPNDHWAAPWIDELVNEGITSGCGGGLFCPEKSVTRAQMAVFLIKVIHINESFDPPAATGIFSDVPASYWAAPWIEQLYKEGITTGCAAGFYCPDSPVTRDQMAVFLMKTINGSTYNPPDVGTNSCFVDVPTDYWAAAWIKQFGMAGITGGCGLAKTEVLLKVKPINASCSTTKYYDCNSGSLGDFRELSDHYEWWCNGLNKGTNILCALGKPLPTEIPKPIQTSTPIPTMTSVPTSIPTLTPIPTLTTIPSCTGQACLTPTKTPTPTRKLTPTPTRKYTPTPTRKLTPTPTRKPTPTPIRKWWWRFGF